LVFLNIVTIGGYSWVWFWKTWEDLHQWSKKLSEEEIIQITENDEQRNVIRYLAKMNVTIHTAALFVDFLRLFFAALLFYQIGKLAAKQDSSAARHPFLFALALMASMQWASQRLKLEYWNICLIVMILLVAPQIVAQTYVNQIWRKNEPAGLVVRQKFTANEYLLLALGAGSVGLVISFLLPGIPLPHDLLPNLIPDIFKPASP